MSPATAGVALYGAPLWPAGHLPLKEGDWQLGWPDFFRNAEDWRKQKRNPISPLEGEMSGRTEGGATERNVGPSARFSPS